MPLFKPAKIKHTHHAMDGMPDIFNHIHNMYMVIYSYVCANIQTVSIIPYIPLILEFLYMIFGNFMIKMWVIFNFMYQVMSVYGKTAPCIISQIELNQYGKICVGAGILVLYGSGSNYIITFPLVIHLMNRTIQQIRNN